MFPIFYRESFTQVIYGDASFLDINNVQVGDIVHCVVGTKESPQEDGDIVALYDAFPCVVVEKHPQAIFVDSPGQILTVAQATCKPSDHDTLLLAFSSAEKLKQETERRGLLSWPDELESEYKERISKLQGKMQDFQKPKYRIGEKLKLKTKDGMERYFEVLAVRISPTVFTGETPVEYKVYSAGAVAEAYYIWEYGDSLEKMEKKYKYPDYLWVEG